MIHPFRRLVRSRPIDRLTRTRVARRLSATRLGLRLGDRRFWAAVSSALMAASVFTCLVFVIPAAYGAQRKADAASAASYAGRLAAEAVRSGNDAAACRALFAGAVTDARAQLDDARAAHQLAIGDGLGAAVDGNDRAYVLAVAGRDRAAVAISWARLAVMETNRQYQALLAAQTDDMHRFDAMCAKGPGG